MVCIYGDNCWNYALCIRKIRLFNERSNAGKYHSVFTDITGYACISGFVKIEEYTGRIRMQEREMQKAIYSTDYYRKLEKVNDENRKYIHNIEHYMKAIAGLVNENNNREVINIIEEMEKQALYVTKEIFARIK